TRSTKLLLTMHAFKTLFVLALAIACIFADDKVETKNKEKKDVFAYTGYPYGYSGYHAGYVPTAYSAPAAVAYTAPAGVAYTAPSAGVAYHHPAGVIASPYAGLYKP
ncbi:hypothetical protein, partial [Neisseria meningitidis]|uniref:hypothetical protein n=1 Tax=Neisseria meningitidis TaxID=487 RepID=UPI001C578420